MVLPAAELPLHCADIDAKAVLRIVDAFMIQAHHFVRALVFDGATQHQALRRICYGNLTEQDKQLLQDPALRFFSRLAHTPLPEHDLPRLPIRVPSFEGEPLFCLGGPCAFTRFSKDSFFHFLLFSIYFNIFYIFGWELAESCQLIPKVA